MAGDVLLAGAARSGGAGDGAPPGFTQTVYLEYREVDSYVAGSALTITPRAEPFKKEPDWGGRKICRGTINSAIRGVPRPGADPGHSINLPFAWDYQKGKLYLDVNRNGDLTDDAVYSTKPSPGEYSYQSFTNLHLTFDVQPSAHQVRMQINLYGHAWSKHSRRHPDVVFLLAGEGDIGGPRVRGGPH